MGEIKCRLQLQLQPSSIGIAICRRLKPQADLVPPPAARERSFNCADGLVHPLACPLWRARRLHRTREAARSSSSPARFCQSSACLRRAFCNCQVVLLFHLRRLQSPDGFLLRSIRVFFNPSVKSTSIYVVHGTVRFRRRKKLKSPRSKPFHANY